LERLGSVSGVSGRIWKALGAVGAMVGLECGVVIWRTCRVEWEKVVWWRRQDGV
jgi:hypothetical protein